MLVDALDVVQLVYVAHQTPNKKCWNPNVLWPILPCHANGGARAPTSIDVVLIREDGVKDGGSRSAQMWAL